MPVLSSSEYKPAPWLRGGHRNSMFSHFLRQKHTCAFERQRLTTPDQDFIDLDTLLNNNKHLVILCHGLEGDSSSSYIQEFGIGFSRQNFDVIAMNYRGCSGEINKQARLYHSGSTEDVYLVLKTFYAQYESVFVIGFSLGGNLTLKLLGEQSFELPKNLKAAVAISTPAHLESCSLKIIRKENWIYEKRFLISLTSKLKQKAVQFPEIFNLEKLNQVKNLYQFDDLFTAPIHGFDSAHDYYTKCSSKQFLSKIETPTLMISALDDPFLSDEAIPYKEANENHNLFLYPCTYGGHVGFFTRKNQKSWMELKSLEFIRQYI